MIWNRTTQVKRVRTENRSEIRMSDRGSHAIGTKSDLFLVTLFRVAFYPT